MGLLDDAIREHLDLKRRRGADPTEVERLEREALGPVRRNREAAADAESEALEAAAPADDDLDEPDEPVATDPADEVPPPLTVTPSDDAEADWDEDDPFDDDRPPAAGDATSEFDVEEALSAEAGRAAAHGAGPDEDGGEVDLEETPEFLQDTPDHDRLWFEQRPPRDFDFDG